MSLHLDARRRAMLEEMGITLWWPQMPSAPAAPLMPVAPTAPAATAPDLAAKAPAPRQAAAPSAAAAAPTPAAPPPSAPAAPRARPAVSVAPPGAASPGTDTDPHLWHMAPWVQLFPQASGPAEGGAWLIVLESPSPLTPLAGDVGQLLHNMLRALRLHEHPQVWLAGVQRPDSKALPIAGSLAPVDWQPLATRWPQALASVQPARVLVLGQKVAHTLLQRHEPVGQLRLQTHALDGIPTAVSYDPAYLLRAAHAKPNAWADLCRAWHLGRSAA